MAERVKIRTGEGFWNPYYAKDNHGNEGVGNTQEEALQALRAAQERNNALNSKTQEQQ